MNDFFRTLLVLLLFTSLAFGEERPFTPIKNDFVENGVPFVVDISNEYSEENLRSEAEKVDLTEEDSSFSEEIDEDTPVTHEEIAGEKNLTSSRPWKAPDFSSQEKALGYGPQAFAIPAGMEKQFKFWVDIYSKYNTDQGVLHDAEYIDLIYEELDFSAISSRTDIKGYQKEHMKIKMVKEGKRRVIALLEKLSKLKEPTGLTPPEMKVWEYFEKIKGPKKFSEAAKKNRLRFQLWQRDRVIQGIYFSGRYIEEFEKIFREAGMPIELARLPFVESSYNVLARSKVGASGLWQIMPYTMKGFMKRDLAIDLRNHPMEATKVAAKLLRINFNMLQSWPLAMTGYNHGPSGVLKLTKKYKTRELSELVTNVASRKRFGFASRNFYASFLAVLEVTNDAPKYLGAVTWSQPLEQADIKLPLAVGYRDLLRWFDGDDLKTQIYNPHITRIARTRGRLIPKGVVISISKAKMEVVSKELESPDALKQAQLSGGNLNLPNLKDEKTAYRVRKGDTVQGIAQQFGVPVGEILTANNMKKVSRLRVGQVLKIP